eukprot:7288935-Pyramimonas_sp.AAC.1
MPWMMRSRARADYHRPAPLPSLKGVGRPNRQLRLGRSPAPALLYRSNDSPNSRKSSRERRAISSKGCFGLDGKWYTSR